jgi:hypothetical protein
MSAVVGIDLSTKCVDLVKLDETTNAAKWVRCELTGKTPWDRALDVRISMAHLNPSAPLDFWQDVYLIAIERPVNDQKRVLRLIQGAVAASLPARLRQPHCCWEVHPSTWKAGLGLKSKPTVDEVRAMVDSFDIGLPPKGTPASGKAFTAAFQNALDAYCLALYARTENAKGVAA